MTHFEKEKHHQVHYVKNKGRTTNTPQKIKNMILFFGIIQVILLVFIAYQVYDLNQSGGLTGKTQQAKTAATGTPTKAAPTKAAAPTAPTKAAAPTQAPPTPTAKIVDMVKLADDDAVKGSKDAKVTIVEWSDYECPYCTRFYKNTLFQIDNNYIKTGKVKLIYRDYPLNFHKNSQKAAEAAECAGEQGKYYEMHNMLFEKGVSGGVSSYKQYAKDLKVDTTKFNTCLDSGKMAGEVKKDLADGQAVGIKGTPGFVINGKIISGARPFSDFKQVIDAELAK